MKTKLISWYYFLLILVLSCQALYTVYKLGGTVGQGEKISQLQQEQQHLEKDLQTLRETHSVNTALTALAEETPADYQAIAQPIILTAAESVASR